MSWENLQDWIKAETGYLVNPNSRNAVGGGCINETYLFVTEEGTSLFVKLNSAESLDLFEGEFTSLNLLRAAGAIRVPEPYAFGVIDGHSVLVMEGLDLFSWQDAGHQAKMGSQLAEMHRNHSDDGFFGADFDNHIGRTPQINTPSNDWCEFFISRRLDFQFQLAAKNGGHFKDLPTLFFAIRQGMAGYDPEPSLLHGDLWSGNAAFDESGNPVIFDPACYYGDREAEIAFTGMFGGFSPSFYRAYREHHPAPENVEWLHRLYNLYHELNHFNLFGGGYRRQSESTIRFLVESFSGDVFQGGEST